MAKTKNNNYFSSMISQRGENWIVTVRPDEIQRSTKKIVRDMVKGNIEYEKYGEAFLNPNFLENLLIGVSNELEDNTFNYDGCKLLLQAYHTNHNNQTYYSMSDLIQHINYLEKLVNIYGLIRSRLIQVKYTGNIGYLTNIATILYNDRNYLN
jgi:hypothetical protein